MSLILIFWNLRIFLFWIFKILFFLLFFFFIFILFSINLSYFSNKSSFCFNLSLSPPTTRTCWTSNRRWTLPCCPRRRPRRTRRSILAWRRWPTTAPRWSGRACCPEARSTVLCFFRRKTTPSRTAPGKTFGCSAGRPELERERQ